MSHSCSVHTHADPQFGNPPLRLRWTYRNRAHAEQVSPPSMADCLHNPAPVPLAPPYHDQDQCHVTVGQTCADAQADVDITNVSIGAASYRYRVWGSAYAKVDRPPFTGARATASGSANMSVLGSTFDRQGNLHVATSWTDTKPIAGATGYARGSLVRDPIVAHRTDLNTGITTSQVLLSIKARVDSSGQLSWMNDHLVNSSANISLDVDLGSPWTVQHGAMHLKVEQGIVTESAKTGVFSAAALPAVGDSAQFNADLPSEFDLDYDMGGSDTDNLAVQLDFSNGGDAEAVDASLPIMTETLDTLTQAWITDLDARDDLAPVSEVEPPSTTFGYNVGAPSFHLADDFSIPPGACWQLAGAMWPIYQAGSAPSDPIQAAFVRLWDGTPGAGGVVLAGDMSTNRLLSANFTGAYRVSDSDLSNTQRAVKEIWIDLTWLPALCSGTYWIEVSMIGQTPFSGPFAVAATPHRAGGNARVFNAISGTWSPITDSGGGWPVDFPFTLFRAPPGDVNGDGLFDGGDTQQFVTCLLGGAPTACSAADFDADGLVDLTDAARFVEGLIEG